MFRLFYIREYSHLSLLDGKYVVCRSHSWPEIYSSAHKINPAEQKLLGLFYTTYMRFIYVRRVIYFSIYKSLLVSWEAAQLAASQEGLSSVGKSLLVGFEVLTEVVMKSTVFWDITPCSPLKATRHFGGTCRLRLQGRISRARYQREGTCGKQKHSVISQNIALFK
jgi:hypothetical protein